MTTQEEQVYQAPESSLQDEGNTPPEQAHLAGRGTRLAAAIIDSLIVMAVVLIPLFSIGVVNEGGDPFMNLVESGDLFYFSAIGIPVLVLMAINIYLLHQNGQTIAKKMLNIKIVRADGSRCNMPRLLGLRIVLLQLLYQIPLVGSIFSIINALFIFREDRRCIHDLIADTIVIEADANVEIEQKEPELPPA